MASQRLAALAWVLGVALVGFGRGPAGHGGGGGHGGGPGHALAGRGFSGRGYGTLGYGRGYGYYGYGRGYGYYGYPGYYGLGLGFGAGYGYGNGYGYPYGYGYGYPNGYAYPVYVDVNAPPPSVFTQAAGGQPAAIAQAGPVAQAPPAGPQGGPPPGTGPVRLTDSDLMLSIRVPPDAVVRINGTPTSQGGPRREFVSSGLSPGRTYTFVVDAHWKEPDGHVVDLERRLRVVGGERRNVDFTSAQPGE